MAQSFRTLIDNMPPERRAKIDTLTHTLLAAMPGEELRRARELTYEQVASTLNMNPEDVAKIEGETDLYITTFRRFIEAMGGELEVIAHLPQGNVMIQTFQHLERCEAV